MNIVEVRADLIAEQDDLDQIVADLSPEEWDSPTPSPRWAVRDQIGHLTYFDGAASTAITSPEDFHTMVNDLLEAGAAGDEAMDEFTLGRFRSMTGRELLESWRLGRKRLAEAAAQLDETSRIDWYGPSMGSNSFLTARLMETWAHGQDIVDALSVERRPTERLRHICQLGFLTRGWSYVNRGEPAPVEPVRVELTSPEGSTWAFGPEGADERLMGTALDFCLVVTQRRHIDDTGIVASSEARHWMERAQAFAGPPTLGPAAGTRAR